MPAKKRKNVPPQQAVAPPAHCSGAKREAQEPVPAILSGTLRAEQVGDPSWKHGWLMMACGGRELTGGSVSVDFGGNVRVQFADGRAWHISAGDLFEFVKVSLHQNTKAEQP